jgi:GH25 family lysozyme M1 (1,4-beta-N-acetylmuramidase)
MLKGFDVSHWQGAENWAGMKATYGISFGFIKATESTTFQDSRFGENWPAIRAAGLVRGAYHFARPSESTAIAQADYFVNYVGAHAGFSGTDLPILDFETSGGLGTNKGLEWCIEWSKRVRARTGLVPLIYMGSWAVDDVTVPKLRDHFCAWWFPRYATAWLNKAEWPPDYSTMTVPAGSRWGEQPDIWQFSQSFPVGGEAHDGNISRLTLDELRSLNTRTANGEEEDVPLSQDDISKVAAAAAAAVLAAPVNKTLTSETAGGTLPLRQAIENIRRWTHMNATTAGEISKSVAALVALGPPVADVDENALVAALTPLLQSMQQLNTETLQAIATAVSNELSTRLET